MLVDEDHRGNVPQAPQQAALSLRMLSVGPELGHVTSLGNLYMTNQVKCHFETDLKPEVDMELKNRK